MKLCYLFLIAVFAVRFLQPDVNRAAGSPCRVTDVHMKESEGKSCEIWNFSADMIEHRAGITIYTWFQSHLCTNIHGGDVDTFLRGDFCL